MLSSQFRVFLDCTMMEEGIINIALKPECTLRCSLFLILFVVGMENSAFARSVAAPHVHRPMSICSSK